MSKLILQPNDTYGMGIIDGKTVIATSRSVAEMFNKRHDHVLRDIEKIIDDLGDPKIGGTYFVKSKYKTEQNKTLPQYLMNRDGFTLLAMGFTGTKAMQFKIAYINRFNRLKQRKEATP